MTIHLALKLWMVVPAAITLLYLAVLAFLARDRALPETWVPVTIAWIALVATSIATWWLA